MSMTSAAPPPAPLKLRPYGAIQICLLLLLMLRVTQAQTLAERLFQMVGAAVRKPRVPNDKLHCVTDKRLAEADRKDLHSTWGVPVEQAGKI